MEDALETHQRRHHPAPAVVRVNETIKQLVEGTAATVAMRKGWLHASIMKMSGMESRKYLHDLGAVEDAARRS